VYSLRVKPEWDERKAGVKKKVSLVGELRRCDMHNDSRVACLSS